MTDEVAAGVFQSIIKDQLKCNILKWSTVESNATTYQFIHAQCLTQIMGYPDDLALRISYSEALNQSVVWVHSQVLPFTFGRLLSPLLVRKTT